MSNYQIDEKLTPEQKQAVLLDNTNVLVSAAAGCGKTFLLVERVLRKIMQDEIPLNKLIVVTFTDAAAQELKERIENELNNGLKNNSDDQFLKDQLSQLNDAYIMTFHALCLRLLKENKASFNYEDNLNPGSDLILDSLKKQAYNKLVNENRNNMEFESLKVYFEKIITNNNFYHALEHVRKIVLNNSSFDEFNKYHNNTYTYDSLMNHPNFKDVFKQYLNYNLNHILNLLMTSLYDQHNSESLKLDLIITIENIELMIKMIKEDQYLNLKDAILDFSLFRKPTKNKDLNDDSVPLIRVYHEDIKKIFEKKIKYFFENEASISIILKNNDENALKILKFSQEYENNLKQLKKQTGYIEFDDFEQDTLDLLYDNNEYSEVALRLKQHFNEILIDEYQDTNIIQEKIVQALSNGSNMFMVGDLKQSIYRFRKATPQLFVDKYERYKNVEDGVVIDLTGNFRSKKDVLEITNFIFKNIFSKNVGGIDYDEANQLKYTDITQQKLNDEYPNVTNTKLFFNIVDDDLSLLSDKEKEEAKKKNSLDNQYRISAMNMINEIKKLHDNNVNYQEITILVSKRTRSNILIELLNQAQIPYMFHTNTGFFETYEIRDLINLLKVLLNPHDDIALLGCLHSFFFNLNEQDILNISLLDGYSYYDKLKNSNYHDVITLLNKMIVYSKTNHPIDIVNYIYQESNYLSYLSNIKTFEQSNINITNFKTLINDNFDYYNSLKYLIEDIKQGVNKSFDSVTPAVLSLKDDVINIMSIHKSKGLEFNYVFLFDDSRIKKRDINKIRIDYYKNQLILPYFNSKLKISADNPLYNLKSYLEEKEVISEQLRLLYVALTRAKLQLYLFTNIKSKHLFKNLMSIQSDEDWLVDEQLLFNQTTLLDYVLIALLRHKDGLMLRKDNQINVSNHIFNYNDSIVSLASYTSDIDKIDFNNLKHIDDFKVVKQKESIIQQLESITPSKHITLPLNFDEITGFDSYKQGSNVHLVLELLDFNTLDNLDELCIKYEIIDTNKNGILSFTNSDFFKNIIIKNKYIKEYAFNYLKDNKLINGIIDLYVESENEIYIIDYKSDILYENELINSYTKQLQTYYDVIASISEKKISCLIYSLYNKSFIKLI